MREGSFDDLFRQATGDHEPYEWQRRTAREGLPGTLEVPTGCGKTLGVVLAWLYRRRFASLEVRRATPRHLIFTLPMRTLVEQTRDVVVDCLARTGLTDEVAVATLMGGEPTSDEWRLHPERDAIVICTLDMGLSAALNRAYGTSRFGWPVVFGILSTDAHWVFDEVQLMGPAAATSRQLQAFRDALGTALPTHSTWMSATLDIERLRTVDAPDVPAPVTLEPGTEPPSLIRRLEAPRQFGRWLPDRSEKLDRVDLARRRAETITRAHRPGTRTIAVLNTVDAARALHKALEGTNARLVLLHSRFRPPDRRALLDQVKATPPAAGTIVVTTQAIEAGVDITSATLFTEVAPWSSIVQRIGRCNREGEVQRNADDSAIPGVLWDPPLKALPYEEDALHVAEAALTSLDGQILTTREIASLDVNEPPPPTGQVVRRADLYRLFDTAPDLGGNDLDISPYLRDGAELDVRVCWRDLGDDAGPAHPHREELCPVPVSELRSWMKKHRRVLRLDHLATRGASPRRWVRATVDDIRPGAVLIADCREGGYTQHGGWDPTSRAPVEAVAASGGAGPTSGLAPLDEDMGADPASVGRRWVSLEQHLTDVRSEVQELLGELEPLDLPAEAIASAIDAGRWHDLGKSHEVFQSTLLATAESGEEPDGDGPWAKSGGSGRARHNRAHFRHELASAMALMGDAGAALVDDVDRDLTIYLVAAHHGRVRMSIRSFPGEEPAPDGRRFALGVHDGDAVPGIEVDGRSAPDATVDLGAMELGAAAGSWVELATGLRDRPDLGPFRLAFLEALVRVADWRVSAGYERAEM